MSNETKSGGISPVLINTAAVLVIIIAIAAIFLWVIPAAGDKAIVVGTAVKSGLDRASVKARSDYSVIEMAFAYQPLKAAFDDEAQTIEGVTVESPHPDHPEDRTVRMTFRAGDKLVDYAVDLSTYDGSWHPYPLVYH